MIIDGLDFKFLVKKGNDVSYGAIDPKKKSGNTLRFIGSFYEYPSGYFHDSITASQKKAFIKDEKYFYIESLKFDAAKYKENYKPGELRRKINEINKMDDQEFFDLTIKNKQEECFYRVDF